VDLNPSNYSFRASSAILLFELWISIPRIISFGPAAPSSCSSDKSWLHESLPLGTPHPYALQGLWYPFSAIIMINYGQQSPDFPSSGAIRASASVWVEILAPQNPCSFLFTRILVAIYQFGCRMSNTKVSPQLATLDGPVITSNALCWDNFPYLRYEVLHRWTHRVPYTLLGFDLVSPHTARVEVTPVQAGSSRGTRIWVS
jgi:hypothetical protein